MVIVEVRSPFFNEEEGKAETRLLALVRADGDDIEVAGSHPEIIDLDMPVLDPSSGKKLDARHASEAWARSLPVAFRSGDLIATIVHDSVHGVSQKETPVDAAELPSIPAAPERASAACATP